jgi:hypothetical protein
MMKREKGTNFHMTREGKGSKTITQKQKKGKCSKGQ